MLVWKDGLSARLPIYCPEGVPRRSSRVFLRHWDHGFEFCHCATHIISCGFDVVRCRGAHVRVTQNALNNYVGHAESIEITTKSTTCCMPAVPLRNERVAPVIMVRIPMLVL